MGVLLEKIPGVEGRFYLYQRVNMNDPLSELAIKYKTDKWGKKHHYTPLYYDLFKDRREKVKKVLEIGVGEGASLRMWRDYFPNALIYGIDNLTERVFEEVGIRVLKADQGHEGQLLEALDEILPSPKDLDLVIDDGSHKTSDQIFSCMTILPKLSDSAVYVIEDVREPDCVENTLNKVFEFQYDCSVVNCGSRYDDNLVVIKPYG